MQKQDTRQETKTWKSNSRNHQTKLDRNTTDLQSWQFLCFFETSAYLFFATSHQTWAWTLPTNQHCRPRTLSLSLSHTTTLGVSEEHLPCQHCRPRTRNLSLSHTTTLSISEDTCHATTSCFCVFNKFTRVLTQLWSAFEFLAPDPDNRHFIQVLYISICTFIISSIEYEYMF